MRVAEHNGDLSVVCHVHSQGIVQLIKKLPPESAVQKLQEITYHSFKVSFVALIWGIGCSDTEESTDSMDVVMWDVSRETPLKRALL